MTVAAQEAEDIWARHNAAWRSTAQVSSQWQNGNDIEPRVLEYSVSGDWWNLLASLGITLLIGREYEHLIMGASCAPDPRVSFMPMPHPSGIAVDRENSKVYVASTRNPNQIFELAPAADFMERADAEGEDNVDAPLVPTSSHFLPGCMYMHDLALIGGALHANAVGENAIVKFDRDYKRKRVWWPGCIEGAEGADFTQNYIQLNSIAAGATVEQSFFTASADALTEFRPGHPQYPVDGRGVLFSGATREAVVRGLTRPHSARFDAQGRVWLDNSGYGEFGVVENEKFVAVTKLPGWTRGLAICGDVAFVGCSRVIPKFRDYAPGLDVESSLCGVYAIDLKGGAVLGSFTWPYGNQIFAIDWIPRVASRGLPFAADDPECDRKTLFYTFANSSEGACND